MNIKTVLIAIGVCLTLGTVLAAETTPEKKYVLPEKYRRTPAERRAHRAAFEMKKFGGRLCRPNSAKGKVVFLNAQKAVPAKELVDAFDEIDNRFHIQWERKDVDKVNANNPAKDIAATGAQLGVALVENGEAPGLLVAPEAGWATVNVTALKEKAADDKALARRVRVEIMRAFGLVAGAAFMGRDQIVLRGDILTASDLDMVQSERYGIEAGAAIDRSLPNFGIQPWRYVYYRKACEEGWAPAPTNDVQKAIWDKVHAIPQKPMKIEFDPKKGR